MSDTRLGIIAVRAATMLLVLCVLPAFSQADEPVIDRKPLSELVKQLRSENRGLQVRAARALSEAPTNLHAVIMPQVIPVLKSERENDKFVAAQVLGEYGAIARSAVPDLLPMLQGTQFERNRAAAAKALGQILKDAKPDKEIDEVTAALIVAFKDQYPDVRREAATACGMIGPAAQACISSLTPLIKEQPSGAKPNMVSEAATWTCERMGPLASEHVDLLITQLPIEAGNMLVRSPAYVRALGAIGPVQDNIVPNILNNMEQYTADNMVETWQALQKFGPKAEQAIPFTKRFLKIPRLCKVGDPRTPLQQSVIIEAMKFLRVAGPKAVEALPEVEMLAKRKEEYADASAINKEAAKTAEFLKGLAAGNAAKAASAESKK